MAVRCFDIGLGTDGNLNDYPHSGWNAPEGGGRWTAGATADLFVPTVSRTSAVTVEIVGCPFLHDGRGSRRLNVRIGNALPSVIAYDSPDVTQRTVAAPWVNAGQWLQIRLCPEHPERPSDVLGGADTRELGVYVLRIRAEVTPRPHIDLGRVHDKDYLTFADFPKKNPVVLDIGANVGQSMVTFKNILPQAVVHSFEINPQHCDALTRAASEFSGITVHAFGLSDEAGRVLLRVPFVGSVTYGEEASIEPGHFEHDRATKARFAERPGPLELRTIMAEVKRGDCLCLQPDIIKIDVEGAEGRVVRGLQETIARHRPALIIENGDYQTVSDILFGLGYEALRFDQGTGQVVPVCGACAWTNTIYLHPDNPAVGRRG